MRAGEGTKVIPNLVYDPKRTQIVLLSGGSRFQENPKNHRMNKTEKTVVDLLNQLASDITRVVDSAGGSGGLVIWSITILRSVKGGEVQCTHVDHVKKGHDRMLIAFITLCGGSAKLGVNLTAHKWYQLTGDYRFFEMPKDKCEITQVTMEPNALNVMWSDVPHFGEGYDATNFRIHVAFAHPSSPPDLDETYLMETPGSWKTFFRKRDCLDIVSEYQLTEKQLKAYESAKQFIEKN